jgi:predicted enzyme related to lactoylglutathione lyase
MMEKLLHPFMSQGTASTMNTRFSNIRSTALVGLLLSASILLIGGCSSLPDTGSMSPQKLTAITKAPTHRYHAGKFVWHDLLTPDSAASQSFYGKLLGWTFTAEGDYVEIYNGSARIGGMVQVTPGDKGQKAAASWLASMSVDDVDAAVATVKAHQGKVINGPVDMPLRGRGVLVRDSLGAHLVLLHAQDGDPDDREPALGDWLWNEIWTNAPDKTIDFYTAVGNYDEVKKGQDYAILIKEGIWRAGIRFSDADVTIRWVPAVRVSDPASLLDQVENLGGTVWIRPGEIPGNPDTALISDNEGALLILQRWDFTHVEEGH